MSLKVGGVDFDIDPLNENLLTVTVNTAEKSSDTNASAESAETNPSTGTSAPAGAAVLAILCVAVLAHKHRA